MWLTENFGQCPDGVPEHVVERYAKVWLWHFLGAFLFPDSSGNTITWIWKNAEQVTGRPERQYRFYTDLLDVLGEHQVRYQLF